jgi:hypothetical protein
MPRMLAPPRTWLLAAAVLLANVRPARGAAIDVSAPDGCVDPATLNQEVADLIGRPLAEVPDADFHLVIQAAAGGRWRLRLEAIDRRAGAPESRHVRELAGDRCADLAEAAAVAIAVSVRAFAEAHPAPAPPPGPAPARAPALATRAPPPAAAPAAWRPALTFLLAGDSGELPDTGVGVMAGAFAQRAWARVAATIGWLPSRDKLVENGGGSFQLAFAAADGCVAPSWGAWTLLGCLGGELGAYRASGLNVARPESRTALWRAGRASLGAVIPLRAPVGVVIEATAVVPISRPGFVLDGADLVFRPAAVSARVGAGIELAF